MRFMILTLNFKGFHQKITSQLLFQWIFHALDLQASFFKLHTNWLTMDQAQI